jgi:hypothetical protein
LLILYLNFIFKNVSLISIIQNDLELKINELISDCKFSKNISELLTKDPRIHTALNRAKYFLNRFLDFPLLKDTCTQKNLSKFFFDTKIIVPTFLKATNPSSYLINLHFYSIVKNY